MASKTVHEDANEVMPDTTGSGDSISADIPLVSSTPWRSPDFEDRLPEECGSRSVEELSATMTGSDEAAAQYNGKIRRPAVGEKVQVRNGKLYHREGGARKRKENDCHRVSIAVAPRE